MTAYWVKFSDRRPGCVEADDKNAAMIAARIETKAHPISAESLPYPAEPRIVHKLYTDPSGHKYRIPSFCLHPEKCKGSSCCPRNYSCVE